MKYNVLRTEYHFLPALLEYLRRTPENPEGSLIPFRIEIENFFWIHEAFPYRI